MHRAHGRDTAYDDFERAHTQFLEELHIEVLAGRVGLEEARRERFRRVFGSLGVALGDRDVELTAAAYRDGYKLARRALAGAVALLEALRGRARIAIVTNNLLEEQQDKLQYCALAPFVDALIASEDVGISKPDPAIFHLALDRVGVAADEAVMVGDSWANDVAGAARAGIRPVWFNPDRKTVPAQPAGVAVIESLGPADDVARILLGTEHAPR